MRDIKMCFHVKETVFPVGFHFPFQWPQHAVYKFFDGAIFFPVVNQAINVTSLRTSQSLLHPAAEGESHEGHQ